MLDVMSRCWCRISCKAASSRCIIKTWKTRGSTLRGPGAQSISDVVFVGSYTLIERCGSTKAVDG